MQDMAELDEKPLKYNLAPLRAAVQFFRVKAPVTWRPPHRAVREDFPHTVPQNTQAFAYGLPGQSHPAWRITLLPN